MKYEDKNHKTNVTDTLKNMAENPKEALKKDYEQTKADMKNVKDKVEDAMMDENDDDAILRDEEA